MNAEELSALLETTGLPVTYRQWKKGSEPPPPYICYLFAYSGDFVADNQNYMPIGNYQVELYTRHKDPAAEELVEQVLRENRLPYTKTEVYLDSEKMVQVVYLIRLIGG